MSKVKFNTVDEYLDLQPPEALETLLKLRKNIYKIIPGAEEYISYQMPMVRYRNKGLICYAGFKNHCSLFVMSYKTAGLIKPDLKQQTIEGGTIRMEFNKVIPQTILKKIIRYRMQEIDEYWEKKEKAKTAKKEKTTSRKKSIKK